MRRKMGVQFFAELEDIITSNADSFGEDDTTRDSYTALTGKLKDLGYDVLLNHRENAEFVPSSRLGEVVKQRNDLKGQIEALNSTISELRETSGISDEAQKQIDALLNDNNTLLESVKQANIQLEIMAGATDAINPKDVLSFIDMSAIKVSKEGKVTGGVSEEIERIKAEKPYLFNKAASGGKKGGFDGSGSSSEQTKKTMNELIRASR